MVQEAVPRKPGFFDRDIQWLNFNQRVLAEALNKSNPLLERINFIGIFNSNLDEFFMKRMGFIMSQVLYQQSGGTLPGRDPKEHLSVIRKRVLELTEIQRKCFFEDLLPELSQEGIFLYSWIDLNEKQKTLLSEYFLKNIFPVLTPIALDPGHPFPFISNLSQSLAVTLFYPGSEEKVFSRVKIPTTIPQLIRVETETPGQYAFIRLSELISHHLQHLFPKMEIGEKFIFRVTRNAEIEWSEEEEADNLLEWISHEVRQRRFGEVVRIEFGGGTDSWVRNLLIDELELGELHIYDAALGLDSQSLKILEELNIPKLRNPTWTPLVPKGMWDERSQILNTIRAGDILVHHPYESFSATVVKMVEAAVEDPKVQAIKMTVYRTGGESPFMPLLVRAAELGKQVVCLVELRARFDEEQNIFWARKLEDAGVHVVYGLVGFKTHAKIVLVVRAESDGMRCYAHMGTGNYNKNTANIYEDFGLFTADPQITGELVEVFNYLTGRSLKKDYSHLIVAPVSMREEFLRLITVETENARAGKPSEIIAKFNSLEDQRIITALYEASSAGVKIHLFVRGFCCLQPQAKDLSENITVTSIVGRFLEHSRLYYFRNGQSSSEDGRFYISSADWMYRNLNNRVEVAAPIYRKEVRQKLWAIIQMWKSDTKQAWTMDVDGNYHRNQGSTESGTHDALMKYYRLQNQLEVQT